MISELEFEHQHIEVGGKFGGLDSAEFVAMNPNRRLPVIVDDEVTIWESHAIIRYLAAKCSAGQFWSNDPANQSYVDRWLDWSQIALPPSILNGVFWDIITRPSCNGIWRPLTVPSSKPPIIFACLIK